MIGIGTGLYRELLRELARRHYRTALAKVSSERSVRSPLISVNWVTRIGVAAGSVGLLSVQKTYKMAHI